MGNFHLTNSTSGTPGTTHTHMHWLKTNITDHIQCIISITLSCIELVSIYVIFVLNQYVNLSYSHNMPFNINIQHTYIYLVPFVLLNVSHSLSLIQTFVLSQKGTLVSPEASKAVKDHTGRSNTDKYTLHCCSWNLCIWMRVQGKIHPERLACCPLLLLCFSSSPQYCMND